MATVQMNTRMDVDLKQQGDAILAEMGYTPSQAVRALWRYIVSCKDQPQQIDQVLAEGAGTATPDARLNAIERGRTICQGLTGLPAELSSASYKELRDVLLDVSESDGEAPRKDARR